MSYQNFLLTKLSFICTVLLLGSVNFTNGGCTSYGHSCLGGHGKRRYEAIKSHLKLREFFEHFFKEHQKFPIRYEPPLSAYNFEEIGSQEEKSDDSYNDPEFIYTILSSFTKNKKY
ncbi:neuropeptide CCHamide-2 [Tachypleus tridentatus]|uniref:neuropeptide CCHamide-2 n=1 Tax=Tachypleus tridentatus TaxID=6853 RepID=UPI003FD539FC